METCEKITLTNLLVMHGTTKLCLLVLTSLPVTDSKTLQILCRQKAEPNIRNERKANRNVWPCANHSGLQIMHESSVVAGASSHGHM